MSDETLDRFRELFRAAERSVFFHDKTPALDVLAALTKRPDLPGADAWDNYGERGPVAALEERVTSLLGKPAAAFFPSGIMAQQSVLRVCCDRSGTKRVALPDLSHLLLHEDDGPRLLHGFDFVHLTTGGETPTASSLAAIRGELAAVLVELPLRDGGYLLPQWDDLVELSRAARERGVPLHVDGARLWESQPFYGRPLAEIAELADTVYVSFYKGLAGFSGAAVAGPEDVVEEAKAWRKRMGGTLFSAYPIALAALAGLEDELPRMGEYHERAKLLAAAFHEAGLPTTPEVPQTNSFRVYAEAPAAEVTERVIAFMERERLTLTAPWQDADVPGWSYVELVVAAPNLRHPVEQVVSWLTEVAGLLER